MLIVSQSEVEVGNDREAELLWVRATEELERVLEVAAREQRLITYTDVVAEITALSLDPRSPELAKLLCERIITDVNSDQPLLSSIVIGRRTNRPGKGYFQFVRRYFRIEDDEVFWLGEVDSVHAYYRRRNRNSPAPTASRRIRQAKAKSLNKSNEKDFIMSFFD